MSEAKLPHLVHLGVQRHTELTGFHVIGNVIPVAYVSGRADAEALILAVNSHAKLVEALRGYMSILNSSDAISDSKKAVQRRAALWKSATAALREAEGLS